MNTTKIQEVLVHPANKYHLGMEAQNHKGLKGIMERHVQWLREPRSELKSFGITCLKLLECAGLAITLVGIYYICKGAEYSKTLDSYAEFEKLKKSKHPPPFATVDIKSDTAGFNHINYYAIYDGALWFKPIKSPDAAWKMFYFDGMAQQRIPEQLSVDGANLVVKDNKGYIHYKKVLGENPAKSSLLPEGYQYTDKTLKSNWKEEWFSLPMISKLVNLVKEASGGSKLLKIEDDIISWCISHRGKYNRYYTDQANKKHEVSVGVTQLFRSLVPSNYLVPF